MDKIPYNLAWYIINNHFPYLTRMDKEDCVQEMVLKYWLALPKYNSCKSTLTTFAYTVMYRRAIDYIRQNYHPETILTDFATIPLEHHDHYLEAQFTPRQQNIIDLLLKGATDDQICLILKISMGTYKLERRHILKELKSNGN